MERPFVAAVVSAATKTNMLTGMNNDCEYSKQLYCLFVVARRDVKKDRLFPAKYHDSAGDGYGRVLVKHRTWR